MRWQNLEVVDERFRLASMRLSSPINLPISYLIDLSIPFLSVVSTSFPAPIITLTPQQPTPIHSNLPPYNNGLDSTLSFLP